MGYLALRAVLWYIDKAHWMGDHFACQPWMCHWVEGHVCYAD